MELYDLAVIGGGINGAGVARDAAGRGLKVLLAEQSDFASSTSSASTKLIHGGLRYLEYYEFRTRYSGLDPHWLARLLRRHGTLAAQILEGAKAEADLGEDFGGGLYERELAYLTEYEWARSGEDVLWRRTKCGLHMSAAQRRRVEARLAGAQ